MALGLLICVRLFWAAKRYNNEQGGDDVVDNGDNDGRIDQ